MAKACFKCKKEKDSKVKKYADVSLKVGQRPMGWSNSKHTLYVADNLIKTKFSNFFKTQKSLIKRQLRKPSTADLLWGIAGKRYSDKVKPKYQGDGRKFVGIVEKVAASKFRSQSKEHTKSIIPTPQQLKRFGFSTFFNKAVGKITLRAYDDVLRTMRAKDRRKAAHFSGYANVGRTKQLSSKLRQRMSAKVAEAMRLSMLEAQEMLLEKLNESVGWRNLTGNAYTGLVSLCYFKTHRGSAKKMLSVAEKAGKSRRATRKKLKPGGYGHSFIGEDKKRHRKSGMFFGRRYDHPEQFFAVKEGNWVMETSGGFAYNDAVKSLNEAMKLAKGSRRKNEALLVLASGAEYIHTLETKAGVNIMTLAEQIMTNDVRKSLAAYLR